MNDNNNNTEVDKKRLFEKNSPTLTVLLAGIFLMLAGVFILLLIKTIATPTLSQGDDSDLQQTITDYADEQKQIDIVDIPQAIVVDPSDISEEQESSYSSAGVTGTGDTNEEEGPVTSDTIDKTAVVVDIEDENDVAYTKEFILKEMTPYFEANNLEAVWDLAHLKRYVKLSEGLKGTNTYYYQGEVDGEGLPNGKGLAIYENNTYYYGSWSHGLREGNGRWYRFYINASDKITNNKKYQAHSYAGDWKNDLPNGGGAEHYDVDITKLEPYERIIQNVVGNFTDGLYDDYMYANTVNYVGLVEEWYGTARKGVFESWEDISSLGEYFAWQNKDDKNLYMKIDKVDNKNQGMREMLNFNSKK